jgi:hypothetical protein
MLQKKALTGVTGVTGDCARSSVTPVPSVRE